MRALCRYAAVTDGEDQFVYRFFLFTSINGSPILHQGRDTTMAAMFSGDREVLKVLSIYLTIGPVTEVEKKLQMDIFHKPHSEDHSEGKGGE